MNNKLDKLINPPWMKSLRALEKATIRFKAHSLDFSAMEVIRKVKESTQLSASVLDKANALKASASFIDTSKIRALAMQNTELMKSAGLFAQNVALDKSISMDRISSQLEKSSTFASIALQQSETMQKLTQFNELSSFSALTTLKNSPFNNINSKLLFDVEQYPETQVAIDEPLLEIDQEIYEEVSSASDFNVLSNKSRKIILYLFHYYFLPLLLAHIYATYISTNAIEARKELQSVSTPVEAKSFVKSPSLGFERASLKGFRVTFKRTNFREAPGMKSKVITTLPIGTLVEVIDKSNRSWLLVEVEIDGVLEQGWVVRRHTARFK